MPVFRVWGSCITRDALDFAADSTVVAFSSRESIVSACTPPIPQDKLEGLRIAPDCGNFARRMIEDDIYKRGLPRINGQFAASDVAVELQRSILIIDLTEERTPLLTDGDGHVVTFSSEAYENSNIESLFSKRLEPFSPEYVDLVKTYLPFFVREISKTSGNMPIIIHRALFPGTHACISHNNECLREFYDLLAHSIPQSISIEVPEEIRISSVVHRWGPYSLHMGDEYYKYLLHLISRKLGINIRIKNDFSVQNMEKSTFFSESQHYCKSMKDMYGDIYSRNCLSMMQHMYIVERELEEQKFEKRELEIRVREMLEREAQRKDDYVLKADITPWWLMKKAVKRVLRKIQQLVVAIYTKVLRQK